jgi:rhodanese-related sulfurtransferase
MMNLLKSIFGGTDVNAKKLVENGAMIVDVRTPDEFKGGHIKGAVNMPIGTIANNLNKLQKHQGPILVYCRSGNRSSMAVREMKSYGLDAHNGGGLGEMQAALR